MSRDETLATILDARVIGIVRLDDAEAVVPVVRAISDGGVRCVEVSLTTPGALEGVARIAAELPEVVIGAGTVCILADAAAAMDAGARFLVTPVTEPALLPPAHARGVPVVMGAFTPTEMYAAARCGADLVKLFPAATVGPGYLRAVRAPFPGLRVVPTGGVDGRNAADWLAAGAVAHGVGGALTDAAAIAGGRLHDLTEHARRLMEAVRRHDPHPDASTRR